MGEAHMPRTVIITGGLGGIGWACCRLFAERGDAVFIGDRPLAGFEPRVASLHDLGAASAEFRVTDICSQSDCDALVDVAIEVTGRLDVLVNCAGSSGVDPFPEQSWDSWEQIRSVNLDGAFLISRAAARGMIRCAKGGRIVNISSIGWLSGGANAAYGAAKAGVISMTYHMARLLGPHGITANAVAPGIIDTAMVRGAFPGAAFDALKVSAERRTPMRRLGQPEDVAAAIGFLASDAAAFITGAILPVTGGFEILPGIDLVGEKAA